LHFFFNFLAFRRLLTKIVVVNRRVE